MEFKTKAEAQAQLSEAEQDAALCRANDAPTAAAVYDRIAARIRALLPTLPD